MSQIWASYKMSCSDQTCPICRRVEDVSDKDNGGNDNAKGDSDDHQEEDQNQKKILVFSYRDKPKRAACSHSYIKQSIKSEPQPILSFNGSRLPTSGQLEFKKAYVSLGDNVDPRERNLASRPQRGQ